MDSTIKKQFDYDDKIDDNQNVHFESEQVINLAMGLKYEIDIEALKEAFSNFVMVKNSKFCSIIVKDNKGRKHWKKVHVNIDDHIIIHHHQSPATTTATTTIETCPEDYKEAAINSFLINVSSATPLVDENKPLWKLHVLMDLNCVVLRVHHVLGDEFSLMSMLSACFGQNSDHSSKQMGNKDGHQRIHSTLDKKNYGRKKESWGILQSIWLTFVYVLSFIGRVLWMKDNFSLIDENNKAKLSPTKLVTAEFKLEDFWFIKTAIPYTTIDDVFLGVISCGLSKYLHLESPRVRLKEQQHRVAAILKVNPRKDPTVLQKFIDMIELETSSGSSTSIVEGDQTTTVLLPIYCGKSLHPLEHVTVMKAIMNKKKLSYEANFIHIALKLVASCLGTKAANWLYNRALKNSTLLISNIKGPTEQIVIADNPVTYIRGHISGNPQADITISMVSYAGRVDVQVMVGKEVISDPQLLIKCFQESLLEMKSSSKLIHLLLGTGNPTNDSPDWFMLEYAYLNSGIGTIIDVPKPKPVATRITGYIHTPNSKVPI
ncbi:wax ester synthase/diacylglycerol acyltransferase 11-like [Silene latifolia]|uniref:wax ester synthase/diacylglycerol acyltransferase 11-like n=1 Tax=Silene latifolia TaxID=37657 RepID=UPI003D77DC7B